MLEIVLDFEVADLSQNSVPILVGESKTPEIDTVVANTQFISKEVGVSASHVAFVTDRPSS